MPSHETSAQAVHVKKYLHFLLLLKKGKLKKRGLIEMKKKICSKYENCHNVVVTNIIMLMKQFPKPLVFERMVAFCGLQTKENIYYIQIYHFFQEGGTFHRAGSDSPNLPTDKGRARLCTMLWYKMKGKRWKSSKTGFTNHQLALVIKICCLFRRVILQTPHVLF